MVVPDGELSLEAAALGDDAPARASSHELADQLFHVLYRQVAALAGPRADLDDIAQTATERALRSLSSFEGRSELSTWTYRIAYCAVVDHERWLWRFRKRFRQAEDDELDQRPSGVDSEALMNELRRARRLHAALSKLPAKKRAVVILHELEGLALKEVARIVDCNERTVRSRLRDARKKLAALLLSDPLFADREEDAR